MDAHNVYNMFTMQVFETQEKVLITNFLQAYFRTLLNAM